jgi:hypothetical protein
MPRTQTRYLSGLALGATLLLLCGCATRFSPGTVRDELARQSGRDPRTTFELNLGRFTTLLIKSALDVEQDGELPLAGLDQLQLAVYESPAERGPAMDVTQIPVRGWEPVIRFLDRERSGLVLIRGSGEGIGDLVLVGAGRETVLYARLRGRLSLTLPEALSKALREQGPEAVRDTLIELGE